MIEFSYTLQPDEYVEAQLIWLRNKHGWTRRRPWIVASVTVSIVAALSIWADGGHPTRGDLFTLAALVLFFVFLILLVRPWIQRRTMRRRYAVEFANVGTIHATFDQQGSASEVPGLGSTNLLWSAFSCWTETSLSLLLIGNAALRVLPKRELPSETQQQLRELFSQHLSHERG